MSERRWRARIRARAGEILLDVDVHGTEGPLALVGPNGSGKTTVLRVLAGAHPLLSGEVEVDGRVLASTTRGIDVPSEDRGLGYVPQGYGLFPHLTVEDNVAFGLSTGDDRLAPDARRKAAREMLRELDGDHLARRLPGQLSGGERQRVALARALVVRPHLLLLDEPLAALDATARRSVRTFLAERLREVRRPSLVVTHDARDVEALDAEACVLEGGRIVQRGRVSELRANPATAFVEEFAG